MYRRGIVKYSVLLKNEMKNLAEKNFNETPKNIKKL